MATNEQDDRNVFMSIANGTMHRLHSIISNLADINIRDQELRTPLIASVGIQNDDVRNHVVRLLLRRGCEANAQDLHGNTALMLACMEKDKSNVVALLAKCRDCDPNVQDLDGNTALHLAVERGNIAAVRLLIDATSTKVPVRVNEVNNAGLSALQLAVKLRLADCSRVLMKYGGADTTRIKNREALLDLINEDRAQTPFDFHRSPTPCVNESPLNSARFAHSGMSRTNSDLYRGGSRANSSTSLTRPISDLTSARESARLRQDSITRMTENISRADSLQRDFGSRADAIISSSMLSPRDAKNPFADIMREKSDLYVNNSRTTFKKSIVSSSKSNKKNKQSHTDWLKQSLSIRRPLTPIASRTITEESQCVSPANPIPLPGRLPSIPSGKRLCLVSPCETPTELF